MTLMLYVQGPPRWLCIWCKGYIPPIPDCVVTDDAAYPCRCAEEESGSGVTDPADEDVALALARAIRRL